jgi:hypothetical protein
VHRTEGMLSAAAGPGEGQHACKEARLPAVEQRADRLGG